MAGGLLLVYSLQRGADGLGIDVDKKNRIVHVKQEGQAATDGLACPGDLVLAVDGQLLHDERMHKVLSPGQGRYELLVRRENAAFESQVMCALKSVENVAMRIMEFTVNRGKNGGLGLDMAAFSRIAGLLPGGQAEIDSSLRAGDLIIAVDRVWVGTSNSALQKLLSPNRASFKFMVLRVEHFEIPLRSLSAPLSPRQQPATRCVGLANPQALFTGATAGNMPCAHNLSTSLIGAESSYRSCGVECSRLLSLSAASRCIPAQAVLPGTMAAGEEHMLGPCAFSGRRDLSGKPLNLTSCLPGGPSCQPEHQCARSLRAATSAGAERDFFATSSADPYANVTLADLGRQATAAHDAARALAVRLQTGFVATTPPYSGSAVPDWAVQACQAATRAAKAADEREPISFAALARQTQEAASRVREAAEKLASTHAAPSQIGFACEGVNADDIVLQAADPNGKTHQLRGSTPQANTPTNHSFPSQREFHHGNSELTSEHSRDGGRKSARQTESHSMTLAGGLVDDLNVAGKKSSNSCTARIANSMLDSDTAAEALAKRIAWATRIADNIVIGRGSCETAGEDRSEMDESDEDESEEDECEEGESEDDLILNAPSRRRLAEKKRAEQHASGVLEKVTSQLRAPQPVQPEQSLSQQPLAPAPLQVCPPKAPGPHARASPVPVAPRLAALPSQQPRSPSSVNSEAPAERELPLTSSSHLRLAAHVPCVPARPATGTRALIVDEGDPTVAEPTESALGAQLPDPSIHMHTAPAVAKRPLPTRRQPSMPTLFESEESEEKEEEEEQSCAVETAQAASALHELVAGMPLSLPLAETSDLRNQLELLRSKLSTMEDELKRAQAKASAAALEARKAERERVGMEAAFAAVVLDSAQYRSPVQQASAVPREDKQL